MTDGPGYRPGSTEDFGRLYGDSHDRIVQTLIGVLGDRAAAEDCAQDAFVKAYRAWPRWKPDAPAEAWLHRIAINVAVSHLRKARLRSPAELVRRLGRPAAAADPAEVAARGDILSLLNRLPPRQAAVIVLRHHHGYSNREIAAALEVPESTVGWRLAAAKDRLRREMSEPALSLAPTPPDVPTR